MYHSLKGGSIGEYIGEHYRGHKGGYYTRRLDYGSYVHMWVVQAFFGDRWGFLRNGPEFPKRGCLLLWFFVTVFRFQCWEPRVWKLPYGKSLANPVWIGCV